MHRIIAASSLAMAFAWAGLQTVPPPEENQTSSVDPIEANGLCAERRELVLAGAPVDKYENRARFGYKVWGLDDLDGDGVSEFLAEVDFGVDPQGSASLDMRALALHSGATGEHYATHVVHSEAFEIYGQMVGQGLERTFHMKWPLPAGDPGIRVEVLRFVPGPCPRIERDEQRCWTRSTPELDSAYLPRSMLGLLHSDAAGCTIRCGSDLLKVPRDPAKEVSVLSLSEAVPGASARGLTRVQDRDLDGVRGLCGVRDRAGPAGDLSAPAVALRGGLLLAR